MLAKSKRLMLLGRTGPSDGQSRLRLFVKPESNSFRGDLSLAEFEAVLTTLNLPAAALEEARKVLEEGGVRTLRTSVSEEGIQQAGLKPYQSAAGYELD